MAGYRGKKHGFTKQMAGHTGIRVSHEEIDCYSQNQGLLLIKWQVVQISGFPLKINTITWRGGLIHFLPKMDIYVHDEIGKEICILIYLL